MSADKPEKKKQTQITGKVVGRKFGEGSKSEHDALYLETADGSFILRRIGGNPFHDPSLEHLVGKTITATGFIDRYIFFAKEWKEE